MDHEKMLLLAFIRSCVEMTVMLHGKVNTSRVPNLPVLSSSNLSEVSRDSGNHLIIKTPGRKSGCCSRCCKKKTLYRCRRYNLDLHPDCFEAYHQYEARWWRGSHIGD